MWLIKVKQNLYLMKMHYFAMVKPLAIFASLF